MWLSRFQHGEGVLLAVNDGEDFEWRCLWVVEDAIRVTEEAPGDGCYALEFGFRPSAAGKQHGLSERRYQAIDYPLANLERGSRKIVADALKIPLRGWRQDVIGHLAVTSPVVEECFSFLLRHEFATIRFGHSPAKVGQDFR